MILKLRLNTSLISTWFLSLALLPAPSLFLMAYCGFSELLTIYIPGLTT